MPKERFPGFEGCMKLMRKHDAQLQEEGFHALLPYARKYIDELIDEFHKERDQGLRYWLLELLGEAKSPKVLPVFEECLQGDDESFWWAAVRGLQALNTKESRKALYEAKSYSKATEERTRYFQQELESMLKN